MIMINYKPMNKRHINIAVRSLISVMLLVILLYIMRGKYADILNALRGISVRFLAPAFTSFFGALALSSLRLKLIVEASGDKHLKFGDALSLTFIGYFFNNFLPTAIGGDVVKGYYLSKKKSDKIASYTSVFIDRAIGLFTMVLMATTALIFMQGEIIDYRVRRFIYIISALAFVAIAFLMNKRFARKFSFIFLFLRPMEEKIKAVYNAVYLYRHHTLLIIQSVTISVFSQILFFVSIGLIGMSINARISAMEILVRMPIISAMSLLPSINGLGLREGSTVLLFGPIIGKEKAFAVSIIWLFVLFVTSIIGGVVYALGRQFKVKFNEAEART